MVVEVFYRKMYSYGIVIPFNITLLHINLCPSHIQLVISAVTRNYTININTDSCSPAIIGSNIPTTALDNLSLSIEKKLLAWRSNKANMMRSILDLPLTSECMG